MRALLPSRRDFAVLSSVAMFLALFTVFAPIGRAQSEVFRPLTPDQARRLGTYYAESEFDLTRLQLLRDDVCEVGRACIRADYRNGAVIGRLGQGIALLMLEQGEVPVRGATIPEEGYQPGLPALSISKKAARDLFNGSSKSMDLVLRDLARSPQSFALGKRVELRLRMDRIESAASEAPCRDI